jgi:hypothetical protein
MRSFAALPLALALLVPACDGGGSSGGGGGGGKDADGFVAIPNINGMKAKVPDGVKPNGVGGAAGFHSEDDSFGFVLQEVSADRLGKSIDDVKTETEEIMFKKWIKADKTDDGWVLTYEAPKMNFDGDEPKEVGVVYSFEVRRKIGDKTYKCYGGISKAEGLDAVVEACNSIKAG